MYRLMKYTFLHGLWSGSALAYFFYMFEMVWDIRVYTLLLNMDYLTFLPKAFVDDVGVQIFVHIGIAMAIVFMYELVYSIVQRQPFHQPRYDARITYAFLVFIACALWPTTTMGITAVTPAFTDVGAFAIWVSGHLLFARGLLYGHTRYIHSLREV